MSEQNEKLLTRKEELVLLSILNLRQEAYLIAIQQHLISVIGKPVSLTSVHLPLSRLEKNGLITSRLGEATAMRGGRRKKIYGLTRPGMQALSVYKRISDDLWKSVFKSTA